MKFSSRLRTLYESCVPGQPLVDLCCDHGYLGIHAFASKQFPEIVFVDQAKHGMELLRQKFEQHADLAAHPTKIQLITSDAGELNITLKGTVVIAGVGGVNMMHILSRLEHRGLLQAETLVLAPHRHRELYDVEFLFKFKRISVKEVIEKSIVRPIFVFKRLENGI